LAFGNYFTNFEQGGTLDRILTPVNSEFELLGKFRRCFVMRVDGLRNSNRSSSDRGSVAASRTTSFRTLGAASEKESMSTNSFSEPDGQFSRKLNHNKGQKQEPFWLAASTKRLSSNADGTR
jgi:hypothetical protein